MFYNKNIYVQKTLQKREGTDMKKHLLCAVVMAALTLSACGQEEAVFTLTAAQQEQYTQLMEEVAEEYYWDFDGDSLRFAAGVVPEKRKTRISLRLVRKRIII